MVGPASPSHLVSQVGCVFVDRFATRPTAGGGVYDNKIGIALQKGPTAEMATEEGNTVSVAEMMKFLVEDRQRREAEYAAERERREAEFERRTAEMGKQFELLTRLVEEGRAERSGGPAATGERDKVKLTKLNDSDDIEAYLKTFERMMEAYEVPRARWVFKLAPQLTGPAQQAYSALSASDAADYDKVKKAIWARYDINCETYRRRLREATKKPEETYRQMATRILDLTNYWTRECSTVEELRELIATEQVLRSLPENIRVWVHERKPTTAAEAGQLAEDYLLARRSTQGIKPRDVDRVNVSSGPPKCYECKQVGHVSRDCPRRSRIWTVKGEGVGNTQRFTRGEVKCFSCGQKGHIAMKCPAKALCCRTPQRREESSVEKGHCYMGLEVCRPGVVEGTPVSDVLLDTGCSRTLVRQELVLPEKLKEGRVAIRCACGDIVNYLWRRSTLKLEEGNSQ